MSGPFSAVSPVFETQRSNVAVLVAADTTSFETLIATMNAASELESALQVLVDVHPDVLLSESIVSEGQPSPRSVVIAHRTAIAWLGAAEAAPSALEVWFAELPGLHLQSLNRPMSASLGIVDRLATYARRRIPAQRWIRLLDQRLGPATLPEVVRSVLSIDDRFAALEASDVLQHRPALVPLWNAYLGSFFKARPVLVGVDIGAVYHTSDGRLGCCFLSEGWSHVERLHVWSEGREVSIRIPFLSMDMPPMVCRLSALRGAYEFALRVHVNGVNALSLTFAREHRTDIEIEFPIALTMEDGQPVAQVDIHFSQTWTPGTSARGVTDLRQLAVAIRSIEIRRRSEKDVNDAAERSTRLASEVGLSPLTTVVSGLSAASIKIVSFDRATVAPLGGIYLVDTAADVKALDLLLCRLEEVAGPIAMLLMISGDKGAWQAELNCQGGAVCRKMLMLYGDLPAALRYLRFIESMPAGVITESFASAFRLVESINSLFPQRAASGHVLVRSDRINLSEAEQQFVARHFRRFSLYEDCVLLRP